MLVNKKKFFTLHWRDYTDEHVLIKQQQQKKL